MATSVADAAGAAAGHDRRRQRDDVDAARNGSTRDQPAVRPRTATSTAPRAKCRRRSTRRASTCRRRCAATRPTARRNPSDAPVMILALTSDDAHAGPDLRRRLQHRAAAALRRSTGVGDVEIGGGSLPAVRVELLPFALNRYGVSMEDVRAAIQAAQRQPAQGRDRGAAASDCRSTRTTPATAAPPTTATWWSPGATAPRCGWATSPRSVDGVEDTRTLGLFNGEPAVDRAGHAAARRQRHRDGRRRARAAARAAGAAAAATSSCRWRRTAPTRSAPRCTRSR